MTENNKILIENSLIKFNRSLKSSLLLIENRNIDLYIETEQKDRLYEKRIKYLARLNILPGEQKIDIIIAKDVRKRHIKFEIIVFDAA